MYIYKTIMLLVVMMIEMYIMTEVAFSFLKRGLNHRGWFVHKLLYLIQRVNIFFNTHMEAFKTNFSSVIWDGGYTDLARSLSKAHFPYNQNGQREQIHPNLSHYITTVAELKDTYTTTTMMRKPTPDRDKP